MSTFDREKYSLFTTHKSKAAIDHVILIVILDIQTLAFVYQVPDKPITCKTSQFFPSQNCDILYIQMFYVVSRTLVFIAVFTEKTKEPQNCGKY